MVVIVSFLLLELLPNVASLPYCSVNVPLLQDEAKAGSVSDTATFVVAEVDSGLGFGPRDGGVETALKDFGFGVEACDLTGPVGVGLVGGLGDEAD